MQGVFICATCARWAARRLHSAPRRELAWLAQLLHVGRIRVWRRIAGRPGRRQMRAVKPILQVRTLQRTEAFYGRLGLAVTFRHPDYLIMRAGEVELHFGQEDTPAAAACYIDVADAVRFWKRLHSSGAEGLGPVEDFDYGMREFVITDPDGNRLRVGSPLSD